MKPLEFTMLESSDWKQALNQHTLQLGPVLHEHLERKSRGIKHPVIDFLFEYYPFRPSHLARWSPGVDVLLQGATADSESLSISEMVYDSYGGYLPSHHFPKQRRKGLGWVLELLRSISEKSPRLGCRGLHEWAMVYEQGDIRHSQLPLRLDHEQIRAIVENGPIKCTHFDAFRFFSESAKPLNTFQPLHGNRNELEQPGCLHVNMDLYKWASKFHPWVSSDLVRETFFLAIETRAIDMRASPYDLSEFDYSPIYIETEEGQLEYSRLQKEIYKKSIPLRARLIQKFTEILLAKPSR